VSAWGPVFSALNVRDLPPPHNPNKCAWFDRFEAIERRLLEEAGGETALMGDQEFDCALAAGREFLATLSAEDRSGCPRYHAADWRAIAGESVRILEELGGSQELETYSSAARRSRLRQPERSWLVDLFCDPIYVIGDRYEEGQHRGCAVRFSGAERVAAVIEEWEGT
jgi:hypothetical protein